MDLLIHLDRSNGTALYQQLQTGLADLIIRGQLVPDTRLPSSRALAEHLHISRNTVNLAYQELLASGFIRAAERRGYFVNSMRSAPEAPSERSEFDWNRVITVPGGHDLPEIDKPTHWFDAPFPFIAGQVEHNRFPVRAWERSLREALHKPHLHHSIEDKITGDDPLLLRQIITRILPGRGIYVDESQVMITLGSQQGLAMLASLLLDETRSILIEDPGYLDARHIFQRSGAQVVPVPVDEDGMRIESAPDEFSVVYTTPSHQNPTNVTMSLERRHALMRAAHLQSAVIIEDDYDSEFRYHGPPKPSLKSLDKHGRVVYLGTFSKFLSPGLRLGFMVGSPELIAAAKKERRYTVRHAPGQLQRAMALFIESGAYQRTLRLNRERMSRKFDLVTRAVRMHLPIPTNRFPPGGVSLWTDIGSAVTLEEVIAEAARHGIIVEPGDLFSFHPPASQFMRIGFGAIAISRIEEGIERLGRVFDSLTDTSH